MVTELKAELIDWMGTDITVVNAARVSFDKESEYEHYEANGNFNENGFLSKQDAKLISYLAKHNHWTPFSHCSITLRETVPIFVARQRFKHTVGFSYNEVSRRYVDDIPKFYTPEVWRGRPEGSVKQGSSEKVITAYQTTIEGFKWDTSPSGEYEDLIEKALKVYTEMVEGGIAPEQARMVLPQSMYTSYYTTGSLYAFARAFKLRSNSHAQLEIQQLAKNWDELIRPLYPISWAALVD